MLNTRHRLLCCQYPLITVACTAYEYEINHSVKKLIISFKYKCMYKWINVGLYIYNYRNCWVWPVYRAKFLNLNHHFDTVFLYLVIDETMSRICEWPPFSDLCWLNNFYFQKMLSLQDDAIFNSNNARKRPHKYWKGL